MNSKTDYVFNIVIVGNCSVGKTSLLRKYSGVQEVGTKTDLVEKVTEHSGRTVLLKIGDTAGQERFRSVTSSFYRQVKGVILCYSKAVPESFSGLETLWLLDIQQYLGKDIPKLLVEITSNTAPNRKFKSATAGQTVSKEEVTSLSIKYKMPCMPVSLSSADEIEAVFDKIVNLMIERHVSDGMGNGDMHDTFRLNRTTGTQKTRGCEC